MNYLFLLILAAVLDAPWWVFAAWIFGLTFWHEDMS